MVGVLKTSVFDAWLSDLKDRKAVARITARIDRLVLGNPGDVRPVGAGVSEMRIDVGPGYRVYYQQRSSLVLLLLCGGDKHPQDADIKRAIEFAKYRQAQGRVRAAAQPKAGKKR